MEWEDLVHSIETDTMTHRQVMELCGVSLASVTEWRESGKVRAIPLSSGGRVAMYLFCKADVVALERDRHEGKTIRGSSVRNRAKRRR
jgi:hypothetical protein